MIYLASPYWHADPAIRYARYHDALKAAVWLTKQGEVAISPIVHSHPMAELGHLPLDWSFWQKIDQDIIRRSDKLYVLTIDGYLASKGVNAEIQIANAINLPVWYISSCNCLEKADHPDYHISESDAPW